MGWVRKGQASGDDGASGDDNENDGTIGLSASSYFPTLREPPIRAAPHQSNLSKQNLFAKPPISDPNPHLIKSSNEEGKYEANQIKSAGGKKWKGKGVGSLEAR